MKIRHRGLFNYCLHHGKVRDAYPTWLIPLFSLPVIMLQTFNDDLNLACGNLSLLGLTQKPF
ncbi:hypothetical protein TI04_07540 [Achromatium sp. WMS2]|nr:hypothetical protein TI04_07540 [Achromatium sp. WMS2]